MVDRRDPYAETRSPTLAHSPADAVSRPSAAPSCAASGRPDPALTWFHGLVGGGWSAAGEPLARPTLWRRARHRPPPASPELAWAGLSGVVPVPQRRTLNTATGAGIEGGLRDVRSDCASNSAGWDRRRTRHESRRLGVTRPATLTNLHAAWAGSGHLPPRVWKPTPTSGAADSAGWSRAFAMLGLRRPFVLVKWPVLQFGAVRRLRQLSPRHTSRHHDEYSEPINGRVAASPASR